MDALPIDAGGGAAAVNLPFGQQIGSASDNRQLYPAFLYAEAARVLRPGARLVVLTGDRQALDQRRGVRAHWPAAQSFPVLLLTEPLAFMCWNAPKRIISKRWPKVSVLRDGVLQQRYSILSHYQKGSAGRSPTARALQAASTARHYNERFSLLDADILAGARVSDAHRITSLTKAVL
ncbi:MAG: hypothetical protein U0Z44_03070 [Kouleothrix sp.]